MKTPIKIEGTVKKVEFLYTKYNESFGLITLEVPRKSSVVDEIEILYSIDKTSFEVMPGISVYVEGDIRQYQMKEGPYKLRVRVFAYTVDLVEPREDCINEVDLEGFLASDVKIRTTPKGRVIADFTLAVNKPHKTWYIPCIAWGRNAHFVESCEKGCKFSVKGRFQSREYQKQTEEGIENRTVHEVSVADVSLISDPDVTE